MGFTLIEVMTALLVFAIAIAGAVSGWLYVVRGQRVNSVQNELDIDVRKAMERVRSDLRLSSMDKVVFYPPGVGPFSALSFPMARDDDGDGVIELDGDGKILWDQTIVYHVWASTPNQLRRTTFDPRDNSLTAAERAAQLESVVVTGNGSATFNAANASTVAIFENLFTWNIWGKGAVFDAYSPTLTRVNNVVLGSLLLTGGDHLFKFEVKGKNAASTGYKIGLDDLVVSPCGIPREAEKCLPVSAESGAASAAQYIAGGSWSENNQLYFPATAAGQSFTLSLKNDLWLETLFSAPGSLADNTTVEFDSYITPKEYMLLLGPPTNAWQADWQTLDVYSASTQPNDIQNTSVRVLLRGSTMTEGGAIKYDGKLHCVWFYAGAQNLKIIEARIAEATNALGYCMDAVDSGVPLLYGASTTVDIPANNYRNLTVPSSTSFFIDKEKSYLVSFLVANEGAKGCARYWREYHGEGTTNPAPGSYIIVSPTNVSQSVDIIREPNWSLTYGAMVQVTSSLFSVQHLHTLAQSNGTFISQIIDTHLDAPVYNQIQWHAEKPSDSYIGFKVRSSDDDQMIGAPAWSNISAITSQGAVNPGAGRYLQFLCDMRCDSSGYYVPRVKHVAIDWAGDTRVVDVGGSVTTGPDYGIFELTVDGNPLVRGITIDLTIYQDVWGFSPGVTNRLTSSVSAEVEPRNTGK